MSYWRSLFKDLLLFWLFRKSASEIIWGSPVRHLDSDLLCTEKNFNTVLLAVVVLPLRRTLLNG